MAWYRIFYAGFKLNQHIVIKYDVVENYLVKDE